MTNGQYDELEQWIGSYQPSPVHYGEPIGAGELFHDIATIGWADVEMHPARDTDIRRYYGREGVTHAPMPAAERYRGLLRCATGGAACA